MKTIKVEDGKYAFDLDDMGRLVAARRHGEEWPAGMEMAGMKVLFSALNELDEARQLSVTNILLAVVPGDGNGLEVYAKSVGEVVGKLSELELKIDDLELERDALHKMFDLLAEDLKEIDSRSQDNSSEKRECGIVARRALRLIQQHRN
jgi:hypothetical protein